MQAWKFSTAAGRWAGFGPYYAMFPVSFAKYVVESMCPEKGRVLDPFCGRGTAPFVAQATGRAALGVDINPVAWVFAKSKTDPERDRQKLISRLSEVCREVKKKDKSAENEFSTVGMVPRCFGVLKSIKAAFELAGERHRPHSNGLYIGACSCKTWRRVE